MEVQSEEKTPPEEVLAETFVENQDWTLELVVPADYDHEMCLRRFHKKFGVLSAMDPRITDANFQASFRLEPWTRFAVRAAHVKKHTTGDICLAYLESLHVELLGAQGLALLFEHHRASLPEKTYNLSFNKKDVLWRSPKGYLTVPFIRQPRGTTGRFGIGQFDVINAGNTLLCFFKI